MAGGDELERIIERALDDQADAVAQVRAGNDRAIGAIVGVVMRETKGRADGGEVQRLIRERIGADREGRGLGRGARAPPQPSRPAHRGRSTGGIDPPSAAPVLARILS